VPRGYEALLPFFRSDKTLRETFFSRLKVLWFAGAALSQHVFDEMKELAYATCGEQILFLTGLGATETAPFAIARTWESENAFNMGLPPPGEELKLVPLEGRYEARLRGPNITPGYWRDPDLTKKAFDEEGFYRLGDALKLADPADPAQGLLFDGRIAEDFKLATGTWVHVGSLRARCLEHFAPYVRDVVIAGADRPYVGLLIFPDTEACRALCPDLPGNAGAAEVAAQAAVRARMQAALMRLAALSTGASTLPRRAVVMAEPPSLDLGEATDKGSINQRAVLRHRAALVEALYSEPPPEHVISIEERP
jgi:feruloyl-CoA synthase